MSNQFSAMLRDGLKKRDEQRESDVVIISACDPSGSDREHVCYVDPDKMPQTPVTPTHKNPQQSTCCEDNYVLPVATETELGGVKVGDEFSMTGDGTLRLDESILGRLEEVEEIAETAQSDSETALTTANEAIAKAESATATAENADAVATEAKQSAENAVATANSADSTAAAAKAVADSAKEIAVDAGVFASSAIDAADAAVNAAAAANTTAADAVARASEAVEIATSATGAADNAVVVATEAKTKSDAAKVESAQAKEVADAANETATTASTTADEAKRLAESANQVVATVSGTAEEAKTVAEAAQATAVEAVVKASGAITEVKQNGVVLEVVDGSVNIDASSIDVDNTLTVDGMAADAKAVGDRFDELHSVAFSGSYEDLVDKPFGTIQLANEIDGHKWTLDRNDNSFFDRNDFQEVLNSPDIAWSVAKSIHVDLDLEIKKEWARTFRVRYTGTLLNSQDGEYHGVINAVIPHFATQYKLEESYQVTIRGDYNTFRVYMDINIPSKSDFPYDDVNGEQIVGIDVNINSMEYVKQIDKEYIPDDDKKFVVNFEEPIYDEEAQIITFSADKSFSEVYNAIQSDSNVVGLLDGIIFSVFACENDTITFTFTAFDDYSRTSQAGIIWMTSDNEVYGLEGNRGGTINITYDGSTSLFAKHHLIGLINDGFVLSIFGHVIGYDTDTDLFYVRETRDGISVVRYFSISDDLEIQFKSVAIYEGVGYEKAEFITWDGDFGDRYWIGVDGLSYPLSLVKMSDTYMTLEELNSVNYVTVGSNGNSNHGAGFNEVPMHPGVYMAEGAPIFVVDKPRTVEFQDASIVFEESGIYFPYVTVNGIGDVWVSEMGPVTSIHKIDEQFLPDSITSNYKIKTLREEDIPTPEGFISGNSFTNFESGVYYVPEQITFDRNPDNVGFIDGLVTIYKFADSRYVNIICPARNTAITLYSGGYSVNHMIESVTDEHIYDLIDERLGAIENGTY